MESTKGEKYFEKKLRDKVAQFGGWAFKIVSPAFTGLPDRLVLMPGGRIWFVEIKSPSKKPTPRQLLVHGMLRRLGFVVLVIDSVETLNSFLNEVQPA